MAQAENDRSSQPEQIRGLVHQAVEAYAAGFQARHLAEVNDPEGTINMKIHNVFIDALGDETRYFTALVRSLDSSLGNMLEGLAIDIAQLNFIVKRNVEGALYREQTQIIADLLEKYKRREKRPEVPDYSVLRSINREGASEVKRHDSDYYLIDERTNRHCLIELKIGGDLDNKKARSEKEAILEQYAILSNTLPPATEIKIYFATAYNRYGENEAWTQERVKQYFAEDEFLIGKDFWNFICCSPRGYELVISAYREKAPLIKDALETIKSAYIH